MSEPAAINLLFLGGAKRVSMARHFIAAAARRGLDCNIYSYELSEREPIAAVAQVIKGLRWSDPAVVDDLRSLCARLGIHAVIPFVDGAVAVAAALSTDVFAPCCSADMAEAMFDKVVADDIFARAGLPRPRRWTPGIPLGAHLIAKPRHGSASKGLVMIDSQEALAAIMPRIDDYLIQERIDRRAEYTVDCYVDRSGRPAIISPRRRLEVSGGEVTRTVTVNMPAAVVLVRRTLEATGLRGAVTVQLIEDLDNCRLMIMEINPRLGGGAVCSVAARADLPGCIIAEALGEPVPVCTPLPGVEIARYPMETVFMPGNNKPL